MLRILIFVSLIFGHNTMAQNARGIFEPAGEYKELQAGEAYDFNLTILPFTSTALTADMLEGKTFLDYFYVTKIYRVSQSENNYEATVVKLQAILAKPFIVKPVYIWSLGDRNIPVEIQNFKSKSKNNKAERPQNEFIVHQTGKKYSSSLSKLNIIGISFFVMVLLAMIFVFLRKKRASHGGSELQTLIELLKGASSHENFEEIYLKKNKYLSVVFKNKDSREEFKELLNLYKVDQFSTIWKNRDIGDLIAAKHEILKRGDFGS